MYRPGWKKPYSPFPSDRIKPPVNRSRGKTKESNAEPPKSKQVRKLEGILQDVKTSSGTVKDPKGGCYCIARVHNLSPYTPICRSCGLILCSINLPHYCCPDCLCPLTTAASRDSLISKLESEVASTIGKEIEDKERAEKDTCRAAGAFPALPSSAPQNKAISGDRTPRSNQSHKVMSLGGNNKGVLVASYISKPPPVNSKPETVDEEPERVLSPAPPPLTNRKPPPNRPFENLIHGSVGYQPNPMTSDASKANRRNKRE